MSEDFRTYESLYHDIRKDDHDTGKFARRAGLGRDACTHAEGTRARNDWMRGWRHEDDRQQERAKESV